MSTPSSSAQRYTVVFFHAHPDDEALLTAGTMARLASEGHRVVLVCATDGAAGAASAEFLEHLAAQRRRELEVSARTLGVNRLVWLGFGDSGYEPNNPDFTPAKDSFCGVSLEDAAAALSGVLGEELADALVIYDPSGGYGHPDHVRVHDVGMLAAKQTQVPLVLQATIDRSLLVKGIDLVEKLWKFQHHLNTAMLRTMYVDRSQITHKVNIRSFVGQKRASLRAHVSQSSSEDSSLRTLGLLLMIPRPLFRLLLGSEWFVQVGLEVPASGHTFDDLLFSLRGKPSLREAARPASDHNSSEAK